MEMGFNLHTVMQHWISLQKLLTDYHNSSSESNREPHLTSEQQELMEMCVLPEINELNINLEAA
ncbi:hypothetical protein M8C21_031834 [Ambrosia artemisiifolia]|uniref:Uncharacterized protein n=1 Tax=Ambrosia artemisiifolia TaxID=4212 RepID=A0AAD5CQW4_AMBAR|nr:hypothetical protein M8C21_031834 [Ambrosia artemisiifolia]